MLFAYALVISAVTRESDGDARQGEREKARERRKKRRGRTNIRNVLTSEALACNISLYRSLDHGPCII